jgi:hypothetical protein
MTVRSSEKARAERQARLADALKANLKRRKEQRRERAADAQADRPAGSRSTSPGPGTDGERR